MNYQGIKEKLIRIADRFGYNNSQETDLLVRIYSKCDQQNVFEGLISLFKEEHLNSSVRQELAGRLLFSINPVAKFDLYFEIKECLPHFDLSVEHLPFYFVEQCGFQKVEKVLNCFSINSLSEREKESLLTMQFWLSNYEKWKEQ